MNNKITIAPKNYNIFSIDLLYNKPAYYQNANSTTIFSIGDSVLTTHFFTELGMNFGIKTANQISKIIIDNKYQTTEFEKYQDYVATQLTVIRNAVLDVILRFDNCDKNAAREILKTKTKLELDVIDDGENNNICAINENDTEIFKARLAFMKEFTKIANDIDIDNITNLDIKTYFQNNIINTYIDNVNNNEMEIFGSLLIIKSLYETAIVDAEVTKVIKLYIKYLEEKVKLVESTYVGGGAIYTQKLEELKIKYPTYTELINSIIKINTNIENIFDVNLEDKDVVQKIAAKFKTINLKFHSDKTKIKADINKSILQKILSYNNLIKDKIYISEFIAEIEENKAKIKDIENKLINPQNKLNASQITKLKQDKLYLETENIYKQSELEKEAQINYIDTLQKLINTLVVNKDNELYNMEKIMNKKNILDMFNNFNDTYNITDDELILIQSQALNTVETATIITKPNRVPDYFEYFKKDEKFGSAKYAINNLLGNKRIELNNIIIDSSNENSFLNSDNKISLTQICDYMIKQQFYRTQGLTECTDSNTENYNTNVIIKALNLLGYEVEKIEEEQIKYSDDNVVGYLKNYGNSSYWISIINDTITNKKLILLDPTSIKKDNKPIKTVYTIESNSTNYDIILKVIFKNNIVNNAYINNSKFIFNEFYKKYYDLIKEIKIKTSYYFISNVINNLTNLHKTILSNDPINILEAFDKLLDTDKLQTATKADNNILLKSLTDIIQQVDSTLLPPSATATAPEAAPGAAPGAAETSPGSGAAEDTEINKNIIKGILYIVDNIYKTLSDKTYINEEYIALNTITEYKEYITKAVTLLRIFIELFKKSETDPAASGTDPETTTGAPAGTTPGTGAPGATAGTKPGAPAGTTTDPADPTAAAAAQKEKDDANLLTLKKNNTTHITYILTQITNEGIKTTINALTTENENADINIIIKLFGKILTLLKVFKPDDVYEYIKFAEQLNKIYERQKDNPIAPP